MRINRKDKSMRQFTMQISSMCANVERKRRKQTRVMDKMKERREKKPRPKIIFARGGNKRLSFEFGNARVIHRRL